MKPFPNSSVASAAPSRQPWGLTFVEGFVIFMVVSILCTAWCFIEIVRGNAQIEVQAGVNHNAMEIEITKRAEIQLSRDKLEFVKAYTAAQQAMQAESEAERADVWIEPRRKGA